MVDAERDAETEPAEDEALDLRQQWLTAGKQFLLHVLLLVMAAAMGISLGYILSKSPALLDRLLLG